MSRPSNSTQRVQGGSRPVRRAALCSLTALGIVAFVAYAGARPQESLPAARDVIARHVEAIGGEDLVRSFESRQATGTFEIVGQGVEGTVLIQAAAPDRLLVTLNYEGIGEAQQGFDGETGWAIDPIMGPRLLTGAELAQLRDEADFYADLHSPEGFESIETLEATEFNGKRAYKLRLVRLSGREFFEYFDVESGLMVGNEGPQDSPMGTLNIVSVIGDYREYDGLLLPTWVTQDLGMGQTATTVVDSVEHNTVPDSTFALPAAIQALLQGR